MTAPNGCAHCGVERYGHMQRWRSSVGWHQWVAPSQEQIKSRMVARREPTNKIANEESADV